MYVRVYMDRCLIPGSEREHLAMIEAGLYRPDALFWPTSRVKTLKAPKHIIIIMYII